MRRRQCPSSPQQACESLIPAVGRLGERHALTTLIFVRSCCCCCLKMLMKLQHWHANQYYQLRLFCLLQHDSRTIYLLKVAADENEKIISQIFHMTARHLSPPGLTFSRLTHFSFFPSCICPSGHHHSWSPRTERIHLVFLLKIIPRLGILGFLTKRSRTSSYHLHSYNFISYKLISHFSFNWYAQNRQHLSLETSKWQDLTLWL